uniref:Uncharacterized protein AlNc14C5G740 n=1 Tax=Albugo laibachii Nc14 TaxID=890382 RepID=F0W0W0_9STRA|nr:conserved hypothetical protein [Albugo laibachii Nc14]|eukprot:CCA14684.1 conserved hypothetical protein [Albugo laibachii Nc14]
MLDSKALLQNHADRKVCMGQYGDMRYFVYGRDTLLIILREKMHDVTASNVRSRSVRCSEFDLWQVYDMKKTIQSICFNPKNDTAIRSASGVIAVVLAEGTGVLLTPTSNSAFSSPETMGLKQHEDASQKALPSDRTPLTKTLPFRYLTKTEMSVNDQFVKCHLHLRASKWYETARWQAEDTHLDFIEWAEFGQDVFLIGAGEFISVWKVMEDEVQLYFQRSFDLCGTSMTPHLVVPDVRDQNDLDIKELADRPSRLVTHFGVSPNGKYAATARRTDRIIKLWSLHEYNQLGMSRVFFLGCHRRIHSMQWCAERHNQQTHFSPTNLRNSDTHDMLLVLDHKGSILIWRSSNTTNAETFVLWKEIAVEDRSHSVDAGLLTRPEEVKDTSFLSQTSALPAAVSKLRLVEGSHIHKSQLPDTLQDSLLNERNILTALSRFHFGYSYLEDVRKNKICSQLRTETLSKMNKQLLGDRHGYLSDTHAGESVICGNLPLVQTIQSYLLCAVCKNGDLCLIRLEDAPYSV